MQMSETTSLLMQHWPVCASSLIWRPDWWSHCSADSLHSHHTALAHSQETTSQKSHSHTQPIYSVRNIFNNKLCYYLDEDYYLHIHQDAHLLLVNLSVKFSQNLKHKNDETQWNKRNNVMQLASDILQHKEYKGNVITTGLLFDLWTD